MASGHIDATILANIDGNTQNQTVLDPVKIKAFYDEVAAKINGNYDTIAQIVTKSASATLATTEVGIVEATAGAVGITLTLPSAVTSGLRYVIKKVDSAAGTVTINTTSSQTIDGQLVRSLQNQYAEIHVISNGSNWDVIIEDLIDLPTFGMSRQALINGNFDVWQRGTSFLNAANYTADRFTVANSIDTNVKVLQSTSVPNSKSQYSARIEGYGAVGGAGAFSDFSQYVEDYKYLAGQKVTISGWVKCDAGASAAPHILDGVTDSAAPTITATTWTYFKYTVTVNAAPTSLRFYLRFFRSGVAVGVGVNFAQLMLNVGDQALPFQPKSFAEELSMCQRYYEKSYSQSVFPGAITSSGSEIRQATTTFLFSNQVINFKVKKRIAPTVTVYSTQNGTSGSTSEFDATSAFVADRVATLSLQSENSFQLQATAGTFIANNWERFQYTADAEL